MEILEIKSWIKIDFFLECGEAIIVPKKPRVRYLTKVENSSHVIWGRLSEAKRVSFNLQ